MQQTQANLEPMVAAPLADDGEFKPLESEEARRKRYRRAIMAQQKDREVKLSDYLLSKRNYFRTLDRDARSRHLRDIDMMCRYFNGDQYGDYDTAGVYQPYTRQDGDYAYTIPVIKGHVEQAFMQLMRLKVEYEFSPKNEGEGGAQQLSKMCEKLAVEEKNRLLSEDARMDEFLNTILAGESYRCLVWGVNPDSPKNVKRMAYDREDIEIPGRRECQDCKRDVPAKTEACPGCGATDIKEIPAGKTLKLNPKEIDVPLGENILHIPHMMSVQRDLSAQKLKHSTFIIERDSLQKHVAEWMYQTVISTSGEALSEEVRLKQELERSSIQTDAIVGSARAQVSMTGTSGNGTGAQSTTVERERIYMDVSEYGATYITVEETLPDGTRIEAGTVLGEKWPNGCYYEVVGNTIVRIKGINKNRRWLVVLYSKVAGSSRGSGLQSLRPMNDIVNDSFNLEYSIGMTGHPFTIVARQFAKELPEAGNFLFVDKLPPGGIDHVARRFPGESPTGFLGATAQRIEGAMQFIEGTYSLAGQIGAPDQKQMGTATGVAAATENASGRMIGPSSQVIFADKEFMFQILENIRDFSAPEQKKELQKRFGPDIAEMFFKCNFRQTLNITVSGNTDKPRSMALTQANAMAFGQIAGSLAQVPWGPELLATIGDMLGVPFNVTPGRSDRREAEYRLNKLIAIEEWVTRKNPMYLDNGQAAAEAMMMKLREFCGALVGPPFEDEAKDQAEFIFMQDHSVFMDVYKDFIFGERAKTSSDAMRLVVVQLWMNHYKAQAALKFEEAKVMRELQEEFEPPPPPEDPAAGMQADAMRQLGERAIEHEAQEESKDQDLEREMARREHDAQLNIAEEQAKQQNGNNMSAG